MYQGPTNSLWELLNPLGPLDTSDFQEFSIVFDINDPFYKSQEYNGGNTNLLEHLQLVNDPFNHHMVSPYIFESPLSYSVKALVYMPRLMHILIVLFSILRIENTRRNGENMRYI